MHHTDMNVRLKLDHFLLALGENIGTIGKIDELERAVKSGADRSAIVELCAVIRAENQRANCCLARYDPLSRVEKNAPLQERAHLPKRLYHNSLF